MFEVEVSSTRVEERSGVGSNGKPYRFRTQLGWADLGRRYPVEIKISLPEGVVYPAGHYTLSLESVDVNGFGELRFARELVLFPLSKA